MHSAALPHHFRRPRIFGSVLCKITADQIIWTIAKYIATLSSPVVYGKLGGLYQDCIIRLTKQMKEPLKLFVQKQIVYALRGKIC